MVAELIEEFKVTDVFGSVGAVGAAEVLETTDGVERTMLAKLDDISGAAERAEPTLAAVLDGVDAEPVEIFKFIVSKELDEPVEKVKETELPGTVKVVIALELACLYEKEETLEINGLADMVVSAEVVGATEVVASIELLGLDEVVGATEVVLSTELLE